MKKINVINVCILLIVILIVIYTILNVITRIHKYNIVTYANENKFLDNELFGCAAVYSPFNFDSQHLLDLTINNSGFHNSIFRGKDVTNYYIDGSLFTRISNGSFDDLYVGDYIIQNDITWRIAGFDIYYGKGSTSLTTHHAVIVPDNSLVVAKMNPTNTTVGGYVESEMYTTTLSNVLNTYVSPVFGNHVLEYWNLLSNVVDIEKWNRFGLNSGGSEDWIWVARKIDLMNETQVYGTVVWSSSGIDVGPDNVQFPLFSLSPEFINSERSVYWLRSIASMHYFTVVSLFGDSSFRDDATDICGVRPYFYID